MAILLLRHGETEGNATRVLQTADTSLNALGLAQAERAAERIAALGVAHILCSDLTRAQMTALPLSRRLGLAIESTPLLQERNFGDLRGTPYAELTFDPFAPDYLPPGGESWPVFHLRVAQAFALIAARRRELNGALVVITHGLVCRAILERHVPWQGGQCAPERIHNASLTVLDAQAPHAPHLVNCCSHLDGLIARDLRSSGPA